MATNTAYGELLNAYVLDFLKKKGFQRTARLFVDECRQLSSSPEAVAADGDSTRTAASPALPDAGAELPPLPIDSSTNGFLAEWWAVFWEFFMVNSGRRSDTFAPSETMLTFAQHLGQQKALPVQAQSGGRRPSLAKFANSNGKRRPSQEELTDNPPPPLLLPDAASEHTKRLRVAEAGNRSPQSAALVAQYSLPDTSDLEAYYHHQTMPQQMALQGTSSMSGIPHGPGVNISPSGVPMMSENYPDFLAHTLKTVSENNSASNAPAAATATGSSAEAAAATHQEYLPTLLNGSGARAEPNSAAAIANMQNSGSGSPLSQSQQQRAVVPQTSAAGMALTGGRPLENQLINQHSTLPQHQQQQMLGNRPGATQFASPHMVNSSAPRVVPTQRTKSYQVPPNGSGQPSGGGPPPGTMVPPFVPGNSFQAIQRLMSPPAMPMTLPSQAQALMTPAVGNAQPQGDMRRTPGSTMAYGMQQHGGANGGIPHMGVMTPQLHHPQAPLQGVRQHSTTPGFAGNAGNGNAGVVSAEFMAAAAAAGMDPQIYGSAVMAFAQQRHQQLQHIAQQQQQQQMQQIGAGSMVGMEPGKSEAAGSHAAALQQLRGQQSSVPPNEAPMQGRPPISLPAQLSGQQLMMMAKGMADPASVQQQQQQLQQQRYMMHLQHQGVMPTPLMGNGAGLAPGAHSSPSAAMSAAPAKQADAGANPGVAGGPGAMMGMQSPAAALASPSAAATAAAAAAAAKKPAAAKPKAKRAPKKTAAGGAAKAQAAAKAGGPMAIGDRGPSPFMGGKPAMAGGGVGGNSGTNSTNASASPALAIKASGAPPFAGIPPTASSDASGLLGGGRLEDSTFSAMLSQRGNKGAVLQPQGGGTGLDFDSSMSAFGSLSQSLEDMLKGHTAGMDLNLHDFLDIDNSGNGADIIDDAMLGYNISDPANLSSIMGVSTSAAGNSVLSLNLSSLGSGNNPNTSNGGGNGDPGLLTLPVNHLA
ncbi:Transcriptional activator flo8 [Coemansia spiralis]|uniref:Transcriptional activator flo8 n=2 Tax=Coemansia TaxID=4863 RepID=A0A9W8GMA3_9FUNG|nr:Transcriptional activator flo8 [Coemansia spiralis]